MKRVVKEKPLKIRDILRNKRIIKKHEDQLKKSSM